MKEFVFINGKVVTHRETFEGDVMVSDGKIVDVYKGGTHNKSSKKSGEKSKMKTIDLAGKYLLPGLIDVHVHFRTPGMTKKEDWTTGSKAALAGGVTTVLDMPNTVPPTVDVQSLKEKRALVKDKALVNYGFFLGATPDNLSGLKKIKGVAGVKIYMGSSTGNLLVESRAVLEKFLAEYKGLIAVHAEDEGCIQHGMQKYANSDLIYKHSLIRAPECAYEAVKELLHLAKKYGSRVHICHLSTEQELATVRKFHNDLVTVEVTPHHLFLTSRDYETLGNLVKVNPPLRGEFDQVALWEGIKDGTVDMIATDHAPHLLEEKNLPYEEAPSGMPGVQTMLPLLLDAVQEGKLSLEKIVELTSFNPASKFGIVGKGRIEKGFDADFTVVDMRLTERMCHRYLWTKGDWSPFHGSVLKGWPVMTFVNGNLMYEWRDKFGKAKGKEVKFV